MQIRLKRPGEHEVLTPLWERSVRATHTFLTEQDIATLRPLVEELLAGDSHEWWVLTDDADVAAGFLGMTEDTIDALFLDPVHRGQGGGRLLIDHAQTLRGDASLTVDVNEQNPRAREFYEAMGFAVIGRSATDTDGRPFPLLHMRRPSPSGR